VMGVLSVDNRLSGRAFGEADEALMLALADLAVIALDNARLYKEAEQRAEQALVYAQDLREVYKREKQQRQAMDRLRFSFLNVIGHELKTPVANIAQALEAVKDPRWGALNEKQHELMDALEKQSLYLGHLIEGLVDFAAFTAKQGALQQRLADLAPIIQQALQLALFKAQQKKVTVEGQVEDDLPPLFIDPGRVEEALNQLLDNAIKFNRQGGRVELRAVAAVGAVKVSVRDTGLGIPPAELDSIWGGFFQVGRKMEFGLEGLGLGLALTRYIVEAHGGTVEVESELEVGSTFTITLPVAEGAN
jgi:signal transduction histidine kinase